MERKQPGGSMVVTESRQHRDFVARIKSIWQREQAPDAVNFLAEHSHIRQNRALALELAYEEYCIRRENGEEIDRSLFCRRFPTISRSLFRQIEVDEYLRQHPELVAPPVGIDWPQRGDRLFGFLVVEEIGRGAFGRAYLCAQTGIGNRHVVVKVAQGGAVEADTMGTLDHPNIMSVYSVQEDGESGLTGICMPFVGRSTLHDVIDVAFVANRQPKHSSVILEASQGLISRIDRYHQLIPRVRLRRGSPYVTGVLQIALQIAEALAHAHERGVLHGDLKPSNIVMSMDGIPLIVDFNLAQGQGTHNLVTGGTLPYMSPEQIRAVLLGSDEQDRIDHRSDIFALGAILFELLTGTVPYPLDAADEDPVVLAGWLLDAQIAGRPEWPAAHMNVSPPVRDLVLRCLAYVPDDRPDDMHAVAYELQRLLTWRRRSQRYLKQNRKYVWSATAAAALAAGVFGAYLSMRPPERDRLFARGVSEYHAGRYQEARDYFRQSVVADSKFGPAYLARGCCALQQYFIDSDRRWMDVAKSDLMIAGSHLATPDVKRVQAYCFINSGDIVSADVWYRDLLRDPQQCDTEILNNLAYCLEKIVVTTLPQSREPQFTESDYLLRVAMKKDPNSWQPFLNFAILELTRHRSNKGFIPRDGLRAVRRLIELNPADSHSFLVAAKLSGIVGLADNDSLLVSDCIRYAREAVLRGHVFEDVELEHGTPFSLIRDDDRFEEVLRLPPSNKVPTVADRVIKPRMLSTLSEQIAQNQSN